MPIAQEHQGKPLRLRIVSDLHVDAHGGVGLDHAPEADLTLVAGDWANGDYLLREGFQGLAGNGPVLAVLGNHEWHGLDLSRDQERLRELAAAGGIELLECQVREWRGWRILGCSLWTNFGLHGTPQVSARVAEDSLADFRAILWGGEPLRSADMIQRYRLHAVWLATQLAAGDPARTIVLTHFGPHPDSICARERREQDAALHPYFTSDSGLIETWQPALWVHGHSHQPLDYMVGRTRVVCNPRGYPGDRPYRPFRPDLTITLPAN